LRPGNDTGDIRIFARLTRAVASINLGFLPALELHFLLFLPRPLFMPFLLRWS
jgi:hypothetical protein